ncbi:MAG: cobalamin B12-binding domain-containing protein [Anaerolineae bacterium]|nr:cobalamin B12-binding domain-containing protein [Anaerolineae bacterium]
MSKQQRVVVAAALGECVHVAGVINFLRLAEQAGWKTVFLGPAVPIAEVLQAARAHQADMVGVSYRLTPETGERLLAEFAEEGADLHAAGVRFVFGGTPPVAERARALSGFFDAIFDGSQTTEEVLAYLRGAPLESRQESDYPQTVVERIRWKAPFPILRHHFGLPTVEDTIAGVAYIADSRLLDVISLGLDQDAQENFFHPERQDPRRRGAGGVPVRTPADLEAIYAASRRGNFPLLRAYSGTDDFILMAELLVHTIRNAWCAIPLFWFNRMDGRGPWDLEGSIREHQRVMAWYAERNIPVELNEPHHWGMRDASDVTFVVSAYLSAYNAKAFGVREYIAQMMFNSPPGLSDAMDLAKMLACLEIVQPLEDANFRVWRQTRIGLLSHPLDEEAARGHLAAATYLQMALHPHIVHIVGHTEAHHAATAEDVVVACRVARRAIENALRGAPDMTRDPRVQERKEELIAEAQVTLEAIRELAGPGVEDPLLDPATLARAVTTGILDAPHLKNNPYARGIAVTRIDERGACVAVDPASGRPIAEKERIQRLMRER